MTTPTDPLYNSQWHFNLIGDIETVWDEYDGSGITVAVYDDGVEYTHEDLAGNYDTSLHYRFGGTVFDPAPRASGDAHGTACAGIIGSVDGNGRGGVGVAHGVTLTGVNFLEDIQYRGMTIILDSFRYASNFDVMSNSWGSTPTYRSFQSLLPGANREQYENAYEYAAANGRGGLGTVIVQAAGNDDLNANGDGLNASRITATIAATDGAGNVQSYSNWGPSILIAAPASAVTTDLSGSNGYTSGNYTTSFGGTSAATPTVSGVVALMLEANSNLGWRDVQNILAMSASQTGSRYGGTGTGHEIGSWGANGADNWNGGGASIHMSYGFGMLDAHAAVRMAEVWNSLYSAPATSANEQSTSASYSGGTLTLPDRSTTYANINVSGNVVIEHVAVRFDVTHTYSSDLNIYLVAPDGTRTQLMYREGGSTLMDGGFEWIFGVDTLRGMSSQGLWRIEFADLVGGDSGYMTSASITFYGSQATSDDVYHYTDDFSILVGAESGRQTLSDSDGGTDTINASAVTSNTTINLNAGQSSTIDGVSVTTSGNTIENVVTGDGNDTIIGNALHNTIRGMRGADRMEGRGGNDLYYVDNAGDRVIETNGNGNDRVFSSISFALRDHSQHLEHLRLTGSGHIDGTGNAQNNVINGNNGNNVLNGALGNDLLFGGGGNDTFRDDHGADNMFGGAGNDLYYVDNAGDQLNETNGNGNDRVFSSISFALRDHSQHLEHLRLTGSGHIDGTGNAQNNVINGNNGNNVLNGAFGNDILFGGGGNDTFRDDHGADNMFGGAGNDLYYVDNAGDRVIETNGNGNDRVFSSISFALRDHSQHLEHLRLTGSGHIDGTGNAQNNVINGNNGNNVLNGALGNDLLFGGGGNDTFRDDHGADNMFGGAGNDLYYVDNAGDQLNETNGNGNDRVFSSISFALRDHSQHLEHLRLTGSGHIDGTGNAQNNTIVGNSGNNILDGAVGNDMLTGGLGSDIFRFVNGGQTDTITDLQDGIDTIQIGLNVTSFADLTITDRGVDAVIAFANTTIVVQSFDHLLLSSDDFNFI